MRRAAVPATLRTLPPNAGGRCIVVGDIHGCLAEFNALLEKVRFDPEADDLVLLGDLVGKGPDSLGVLDRAMALGPRCHCILGNHDWTLLRWRDAQERGETEVPWSRKEGNEYPEMAVAATAAQIAFVRSWPYLVHVPQHRVLCVHAGLHPYAAELLAANATAAEGEEAAEEAETALPLAQFPELDAAVSATNSYDMLHVRHVDDASREISEVDLAGGTVGATEGSGVVGWAERLPAGRDTVAFGHDALRKLQDRRGGGPRGGRSLGLDTGCCYGGKLTAWVLPADELVAVDSAFSCLTPGKKE